MMPVIPAGWTRLLWLVLVGFAWFLSTVAWPSMAWAQSSPLPVPELNAHVIDQTATLTSAQQQALEAKLAGFESEQGSQIVVVIVPTTQPEEIFGYTQRLGEAWKIGRKDIGDGLLLVVAKNDRRMRIAPAKALEGAIPDVMAKRVIDQTLTPAFRKGDFAGGIDGALNQIFALIRHEALPAPDASAGASGSSDAVSWQDILLFTIFGVPMLEVVFRNLFGRGWSLLFSSGAAGIIAWFISGVVWIGIGIGLMAIVIGAFVQVAGVSRGVGSGGGGRASRGGGSWGGGGGWSSGGSSSGGGGFSSGGGGSFGGGGASGGW